MNDKVPFILYINARKGPLREQRYAMRTIPKSRQYTLGVIACQSAKPTDPEANQPPEGVTYEDLFKMQDASLFWNRSRNCYLLSAPSVTPYAIPFNAPSPESIAADKSEEIRLDLYAETSKNIRLANDESFAARKASKIVSKQEVRMARDELIALGWGDPRSLDREVEEANRELEARLAKKGRVLWN